MDQKPPSKRKKPLVKWVRTTIVIDEDHLDKLKMLTWWEKTTIKDLFDEMIKQYLSSHPHLDRLLEEREQRFAEKTVLKLDPNSES